ncbi:aldo/keto reductase [Microbacterium sp. X-17]|uniref:aldo/keto reductase n=1 Tax=Microbacterium sp. X-17 TaxID=3144404 RepID=UPI0031F55BC9
MPLFDTGAARGPVVPEQTAPATVHPSGPIPIALARPPRVPLGESGFDVFPLVLGGAEFGWNADQATSHRILDAFLARGGTMIHTSDSYTGGRSEHIIGSWLAQRGMRDDVVVSTRVGTHPDNPGLGPVPLVRAVEGSLTRLGTDRIDVLYLDAVAGGDARLEDILATVDWLVGSGKVRAIAACGLSAEKLVEARILSSAGYPRITVIDVPYNILQQDEFASDLRLVVGAQGIAVTPSHALAHGFLAGVHRSRTAPVLSVRGAQRAASLTRRGARVLRALDAIAAEKGVAVAAVAVAWLLSQRAITAPIVNAHAVAHVHELADGVAVRLSRSQLSDIARAAE